MKVVLFCGGLGLRIRGATSPLLPKPLVPIGSQPILWHLMRYYAHFGHHHFILALGHGGGAIRAYVDRIAPEQGWTVELVDTGDDASIGERLARVAPLLDGDDLFLCNYADGLTDLHLPDLIAAFLASGKLAACICVTPALSCHFVRTDAHGTVERLDDARQLNLLINGGYFVFRRRVLDYLRDGADLVDDAFRRLIGAGELLGYRHHGFWRSVDTFKDKQALDDLAASGVAPWEVWRRDVTARSA